MTPNNKSASSFINDSFGNKSIEELKKQLNNTLRKKEQMEKDLKEATDRAESYTSKFYLT